MGLSKQNNMNHMVIDDGQSWLNIYSYTTFKDKQGALDTRTSINT
jgi:hypothetical protein